MEFDKRLKMLLKNVLLCSRFTNTPIHAEFRPPKIGLGYKDEGTYRISDGVAKIYKEAKKRARIDSKKLRSEEKESESEEISRMDFVNRIVSKRRKND